MSARDPPNLSSLNYFLLIFTYLASLQPDQDYGTVLGTNPLTN